MDVRVTNEFRLAERGEWPPRTDQEIELIAHDWWLTARQQLQVGSPFVTPGGRGFYDEEELVRSLIDCLAENEIKVAAGTPTFDRIKTEARLEHNAVVGSFTVSNLARDAATSEAEAVLRKGGTPAVAVAWARAPAPVSGAQPRVFKPLTMDQLIDGWALDTAPVEKTVYVLEAHHGQADH